jgi:hypothetical protein
MAKRKKRRKGKTMTKRKQTIQWLKENREYND